MVAATFRKVHLFRLVVHQCRVWTSLPTHTYVPWHPPSDRAHTVGLVAVRTTRFARRSFTTTIGSCHSRSLISNFQDQNIGRRASQYKQVEVLTLICSQDVGHLENPFLLMQIHVKDSPSVVQVCVGYRSNPMTLAVGHADI